MVNPRAERFFPLLTIGGAFLRGGTDFALDVGADGAEPFEAVGVGHPRIVRRFSSSRTDTAFGCPQPFAGLARRELILSEHGGKFFLGVDARLGQRALFPQPHGEEAKQLFLLLAGQ